MNTALTAAALLVPLALLAWGALVFNRLVRGRNLVSNGWADIDVQLSRRHDLVPQLVSAVRAYAAYERATLEAVTALRAEALSVSGPARLAAVESQLEQELVRVFALSERYPELDASENFGQLQRELVEIEDHLQYARRFYNGAVRDYNDAVQRFPDVLIAGMFGFAAAEFYQAGAGQRGAVAVDLPA